MMKSISISFIFDFSYTLPKFTIFEIGQGKPYIDYNTSNVNFKAQYRSFFKEQLEVLNVLCTDQGLNISVYFSGIFLEFLEEVDSEMVKKIRASVESGNLELLGGTYYHSLTSIYSKESFTDEASKHKEKLKTTFNAVPVHFYNTENIYYNELPQLLQKNGYVSTFGASIDWYLGKEKDKRIFNSKASDKFHVFLVDSDQGQNIFDRQEMSTHFLQLESHGIFELGGIRNIVAKAQSNAQIKALSHHDKQPEKLSTYIINNPVMGSSRGLTLASFQDNGLQRQALKQYYALEDSVNKSNNKELRQKWLQLGNINCFLNMSPDIDEEIKPYDIYNSYMNILNDLEISTNAINS